MKYKSKIQFKCDGQIVQGRFYATSDTVKPRPTILILSGFPGNEEDVLDLGEALSQLGFNTMTFNYRGIYQSEGRYSLKSSQQDIQAAFDYLQDEKTVARFGIDPDKLVLGGWSYGGGMALTYAANHPEVKHVFSIAGTDHGEFARHYQSDESFSQMMDEIFEELKRPVGPVNFSGQEAIRKELIRNSGPYDFLTQVEALVDRDILLVGAWDDSGVVLEQHILPGYRALKALGATGVKIRAFQDEHAFEANRLELAEMITDWIRGITGENGAG